MGLILRYFSNCEPIQSILVGELKIHLWSLVSLEMTLTRQMSSLSVPVGTHCAGKYHMAKGFCGKSESICNEVYMMIIFAE